MQATSMRRSARHCGIAISTAFRWCHRFLQRAGRLAQPLHGLVEADRTHLRHSRKGERQIERRPKWRGGKARKRGVSSELVLVLLAVVASAKMRLILSWNVQGEAHVHRTIVNGSSEPGSEQDLAKQGLGAHGRFRKHDEGPVAPSDSASPVIMDTIGVGWGC